VRFRHFRCLWIGLFGLANCHRADVRRKIDRDFELARLGVVDCLRARASARAAVSLSNQQDYEIEAFPRILENLAAPFANPAVTRSRRITVKNSRDDAERSSRGKSSRYRVAKENRDKRRGYFVVFYRSAYLRMAMQRIIRSYVISRGYIVRS